MKLYQRKFQHIILKMCTLTTSGFYFFFTFASSNKFAISYPSCVTISQFTIFIFYVESLFLKLNSLCMYRLYTLSKKLNEDNLALYLFPFTQSSWHSAGNSNPSTTQQHLGPEVRTLAIQEIIRLQSKTRKNKTQLASYFNDCWWGNTLNRCFQSSINEETDTGQKAYT